MVVCSLVAMLMGCSPKKPREVRLAPSETAALKERFSSLERVLQERAGFIASRLAGPASEKDLAGLRSSLGGSVIEPLEQWFLWHNGTVSGGVPLLPLGWPVAIGDALHERHAIRWFPFVDRRRKEAIKILDDGSGDGFYVNPATRNPRVFYHMLEDATSYQDFGRLDEFIGFLAKVHEAGIAAESKPGVVVFDESKYAALEKAYLASKFPLVPRAVPLKSPAR